MAPAEVEIADRLRAWRLAWAKENDVPPFIVFSDKTLRALVRQQPTTESEMLEIPGIGPHKWEQFGEALLQELAKEE